MQPKQLRLLKLAGPTPTWLLGGRRTITTTARGMQWSYQDREDDDKKTSAWKDWHRDDSGDEMRSPQGNRKQVLDLLSDFKPNSQCLDNREVFGRKFYNIYKRIQLTSWSQKDALAGREISDLKWFELAYGVGITFIFAIFLPEPLRQLCSAVRPMNQYWLPAFYQQFDSQNDIGTLTVLLGNALSNIPSSAASSSEGDEASSREIQALIGFRKNAETRGVLGSSSGLPVVDPSFKRRRIVTKIRTILPNIFST